MKYETIIKNAFSQSKNIKEQILNNNKFLECISSISREMINAFQKDNKVLICGNGGSAADAQHFAAELSGRFLLDRSPLFAEALHVNTSYITAVANDYSYDLIFSRLIEAKGRKNDILIALSTSGNSKNVINALISAKEKKMITISFTGNTGGEMIKYSDYCLKVPSSDTPRIQEIHLLVAHIICEIVEKKLFQ